MTRGYAEFGGEGYLTIEHNGTLNFGTADFTITFWVKPEAIQDMTVLNKSASEDGYSIGVTPDQITLVLVQAVRQTR